jgi:hypothetical protein
VTRTLRVFVNSAPVDANEGATAVDCIRIWRADEADEVTAGRRIITDSRGLPISPDSAASAGSIYRTVPKRDKSTDD